MTNGLSKLLKLILLGTLVLVQSGCATSEQDLGYKPYSKEYTTSGDTSYHGWDAPPPEGNSQ